MKGLIFSCLLLLKLVAAYKTCINPSAFQVRITQRWLVDDDDTPKLSFVDDTKPKVMIRTLEEIEQENKARTQLPRKPKPISKPISSTFGSMNADQVKETAFSKYYRGMPVANKQRVQKKEDLNGIQPAIPLVFSSVPALMAYGLWQASIYLATHFAIDFVDSEVYPVQRLAVVSRNIVVGLFTLASGFSGVISIGLFLLGIAVAIGVAKGELDPNASPSTTAKDKKL